MYVQKASQTLPDTLYLATQSPRRHDIVQQMGLSYISIPNKLEVERFPESGSPQEKAEALAFQKASLSSEGLDRGFVLGTDTIVVHGETLLGKPSGSEEAIEMLNLLSGTTHTVITAMCLFNATTQSYIVQSGVAHVTFASLTDADIQAYVANAEPFDKAGSYGIQDIPSHFLARLEGEMDTVMGLCSKTLNQMISSVVE